MGILSKDDILAANDRKLESLHVQEWGGTVLLRTLTGAERDEFEASTVKTGKNGRQEQDMVNFRARFVALCIVDESGKRLFTTRGAIGMLGSKSVAALQKVFNKAAEMNGMTDSDIEEMTTDFEKADDEPPTSE